MPGLPNLDGSTIIVENQTWLSDRGILASLHFIKIIQTFEANSATMFTLTSLDLFTNNLTGKPFGGLYNVAQPRHVREHQYHARVTSQVYAGQINNKNLIKSNALECSMAINQERQAIRNRQHEWRKLEQFSWTETNVCNAWRKVRHNMGLREYDVPRYFSYYYIGLTKWLYGHHGISGPSLNSSTKPLQMIFAWTKIFDCNKIHERADYPLPVDKPPISYLLSIKILVDS